MQIFLFTQCTTFAPMNKPPKQHYQCLTALPNTHSYPHQHDKELPFSSLRRLITLHCQLQCLCTLNAPSKNKFSCISLVLSILYFPLCKVVLGCVTMGPVLPIKRTGFHDSDNIRVKILENSYKMCTFAKSYCYA